MRTRSMRWWAGLVAACGAALLVAQALAGPYVILKQDNKRFDGTAIRVTSGGDIVLTTSGGQLTFKKDQVKVAFADRPADFEKARQLMESKKYDEATPILEKIVRDYRYLEWDNRAREVLAQGLLDKGDSKAAVAVYEELVKTTDSERPNYKALQQGYMRALLESKQFGRLAPMLDEMVAKPDREEAAVAQIMRGDVRAAQDDLEGAFMDYMRTVLLFREVGAVQAEATFKAAACLEKKRDNRAKDMYKDLLERYPDSEYAAKAKQRLGAP